jgi:DNA (cytosine-5)-methyltransferase 1
MRKVLNLYAGIGGNRKLWTDVDVTAVELNPEIAAIYQDFFPDDKVIVADAHQYLLEHYADGWDFIWSSPPCPTHSEIRRCGVYRGQNIPVYPDMKLYEEIIFLEAFGKCNYCIENVVAYYEPLVRPTEKIGHHYLWANFIISPKMFERNIIEEQKIGNGSFGFDIKKYKLKHRKDQILRNVVNPELGLHIFNMAFKHKQSTLGVE